MPRSQSAEKEDETEEEVIKRCPTVSFSTPESNKPVPIRPLKRLKREGGEEEQEDPGDSPKRREELSPRRLDMDQPALLACNTIPDGNPAEREEEEEEEEEPIEPTQVIPDSEEEGEIAPTPLVRCIATAF